MASIAPTHLLAPFHSRKSRSSSASWYVGKIKSRSAFVLLSQQAHCVNHDGHRNDALRGLKTILRLLPTYFTSVYLTCWSRIASSVMPFALPMDYYGEKVPPLCICGDHRMGISSINYLLQIMHGSVKIITVALECQESGRNHSKLAKAWVGVDMDVWHGHISFQATIYSLLKTVLERGKISDSQHLVNEILSPKINLIMKCIESQLSKEDMVFVKWFRMEQLPVLTKYFTPLLERWISEYANRSVHEISSPLLLVTKLHNSQLLQDDEATLSTVKFSNITEILLASSCCVAISKLSTRRVCCPTFTMSLPGMIVELVDSLHGLASIGTLHHMATEAGLENEFLSRLGPKVLQHDRRGERIFWMGLLQEKLVAAFDREGLVANMHISCKTQVLARDLAIMGVFAFLGRKTRLFLSHIGIKDIEVTVKDFICYLECGILFLYPELSSICVYQLFMEVVNHEIGWLDLYAEVPCTRNQERKRSKQHAIQAEKEIILSAVFGVCSDIFSSFAHYSEKIQQPLGANLVSYLHQSKYLLTVCLEDYLAAYDGLCELGNTSQILFPEPMEDFCHHGMMNDHISLKEMDQTLGGPTSKGIRKCTSQHLSELNMRREGVEASLHENFLTRSSNCLISAVSDLLVGTQLLFVDLSITRALTQKQIFGHKLTKRERKKIIRAVADIACIIPIAILMLLPVTAPGHAAILTAIKNYIPGLIPSPYSTERLHDMKQLKRAEKMKSQCASYLGI